MSFERQALPFAEDALEPYISKKTIDFHYNKHHQGYVDKLNKELEKSDHGLVTDLEELIKVADGDLYNFAAQVWNHDFYWQCLNEKGGGEPSDYLANYLKSGFGTVENFINEFSDAAANEFGSGWAWLLLDGDNLEIVSTTDAVNPISMEKHPILTLDVWEHAYYLDYQNRRPKYVETFFDNLINWDFVEQNLRSYIEMNQQNRVEVA